MIGTTYHGLALRPPLTHDPSPKVERIHAILVGGEREDLLEDAGLAGFTMDLSSLLLPQILTVSFIRTRYPA